MEGVTPSTSHSAPLSISPSTTDVPLLAGIQGATDALCEIQQRDGHWVGELQGDTILESEYVFLLTFLGRENEDVCRKAARYILEQRQPNGAWSNYVGGPPDLTVSVKAYFALKITGHDPDSPEMQQARAVIRDLGGAENCNSFTRFYLALLGQYPYENCPAIPPEVTLLPKWCYFNLYAVSSWTRTILVPLTIFYAHRPVRNLPPEMGIEELFLEPPFKSRWPHRPTKRLLSWTNLFLGLDWIYKAIDPGKWCMPLRRLALKRAEAWMRERFEDSDGLGAIFPPMIYTVIALRCLEVPEDAPEMQWALKQLEDLIIEENDTVRLQPCVSPVWDTALSLYAITEVEHHHPDLQARLEDAANWLLDREVKRRGDWSETNPGLEAGGWCFEYNNAFYPDTDDTSIVLLALAKTARNDKPEVRATLERGLRWMMGMQNRDGGWAAFDRNIDRKVLEKVPFADHNAMLDPSCADITAHVLECMGHFGYRTDNVQVQKAIRYLEREQDPRGCWFGRWGVNYVYGTSQTLCGLQAIGHDMTSLRMRRAVQWLKSVQHPSGAWGESCASYEDPKLAGQGPPTASQTAWALLGLMAAGEHESDEVRAGINWLLQEQRTDGNWDEEPFTGTGFPKVFYLKYHLYSLYFPLLALARYQSLTQGSSSHDKETSCDSLSA